MKKGDPAAILFTWEDIMSQQTIRVADIQFEQANVLYNIGSLHSKLGSMDNRMTPEGMKVSCTHFQCAAWAFQHLKDAFDSYGCTDFHKDLLYFMSSVMMAQAQECILEKSMTDNRKNSITAKVSSQTAEYYDLAIKQINIFSYSNNTKLVKEWKKRCEIKKGFCECITFYYLGLNAEEQSKWGERLAYFSAAWNRLEELIKSVKLDEPAVDDTFKFMADVIGGKFNSAKKDNDFVYHDKVPSFDSLPVVKGAVLVKGIPLNVNDPEVSGPDIFKKLVPIKIHQLSSLYSEEKAKLLRKIGRDVENTDVELRNFLTLLQIHPTIAILPEPLKLPNALLEKCAALSVRPDTVKELVCAMQALSGKSSDTEVDFNSALQIVESVEKSINEILKTKGIKLEGLKDSEEIKEELFKCMETMKTASQINEELHDLMKIHISNLRLLSSPIQEIHATLSSLQYNASESELDVLETMKKLMEKVDQMSRQRQQMLEQLREMLQKDDITQKLILNNEDVDHQAFFCEELKKHSQFVSLLNQNLHAQTNILHALTETNAKYASIRKAIDEAKKRQQDFVNGLITSYELYEDLLSKTNRGVDFYDTLGTHVSKALERANSLLKSHQNIMAKINERTAEPETFLSQNNFSTLSNIKVSASNNLEIIPYPTTSFSDISSVNSLNDGQQGGPKLKDYLPFMKPATFGTKAKELPYSQNNFQYPITSHAVLQPPMPLNSVSLPCSQTCSPLHVPNSVQSDCIVLHGTNVTSYSKTAPHEIIASSLSEHYYNSLNVPRPYLNHVQDSGNVQNLHNASLSTEFPIYNDLSPVLLSSNLPSKNQTTDTGQVFPVTSCIPSFSAYPCQFSNQSPMFFSAITQMDSSEKLRNAALNQQNVVQNCSLQAPQKFEIQPLDIFQQPFQIHQNHVTQVPQLPAADKLYQPQQMAEINQPYRDEQLQQFHQVQQLSQQMSQVQQLSQQRNQQLFPVEPLSEMVLPQQLAYMSQSIRPQHHHLPITATLHYPKTSDSITTYLDKLPQENMKLSEQSETFQNVHACTGGCNHQLQFIKQDANSVPPQAHIPSTNICNKESSFNKNITVSSQVLHSENNVKDSTTSLDDMLSTGSSFFNQGPSLLVPKVITDEDLKRQQNEEAKKNLKFNTKDPYCNSERLTKFRIDVEKFKHHVHSLCLPVQNKQTLLEIEWKELIETQDKTKLFSMAIARCYPMKNRFPDVMPFDKSRVKLLGATDDYINASLIKSMTPACPDIIATQSPLHTTVTDFWQMVYDYNVEIVVMLCSDNEVTSKCFAYWPTDRGQGAKIAGHFSILLHSIHMTPAWIERTLSITHSKSNVSKSVIHLQFKLWPPGAEPESYETLIQFISHVHGLYLQQRNLMKPIVVHCSNGIGRTGAFAVIYTGIEEINTGSGIIDICQTICQMRMQRKFFVEFERQLKFCYDILLFFCQSKLKNYGILNASLLSEKPVTVENKNTVKGLVGDVMNLKISEIPSARIESGDNPVVSRQPDNFPENRVHDSQQPSEQKTKCSADVQNLEKFILECKTPARKKITKANFFSQAGSLGSKCTSTANQSDPLSELDPLWTMKK